MVVWLFSIVGFLLVVDGVVEPSNSLLQYSHDKHGLVLPQLQAREYNIRGKVLNAQEVRSHRSHHGNGHHQTHQAHEGSNRTRSNDTRPSPESREKAMHEMALFTHDFVSRWQQAFLEAFYVVGIAELFDKTWFVALLLALAYDVKRAFWASFAAQAIHTFVAAAFGLGISQVIPVSTLHFMVSGIFGLLTIFYANEWFEADPFEDSNFDAAKAKKEAANFVDHGLLDAAFVSCFVVIFLAEWGDRTQVAMIALTASLPLIPVVFGGLAAKFLLTASAVIVPAAFNKQKYTDRFANGITALAFATFTALALISGCRARAETLAAQ